MNNWNQNENKTYSERRIGEYHLKTRTNMEDNSRYGQIFFYSRIIHVETFPKETTEEQVRAKLEKWVLDSVREQEVTVTAALRGNCE